MKLCLYRLPELLAAVAAGRTIYVAEGEKSVDLLRGLGLPATCSPGGAGKWRAHHSPSLAGADVVLLPDNDDPGRNHVASVAKALSGIAARVRVLTLPGLPPKGDIADWIKGGGVREGLEALLRGAKDISAEQAEAAAPDEPAAPNKDANKAAERPLKFIEPHTLQHAVIHAREWIVEDWLPIGCATLNFGDGGTGKTLVDQQLMTSCATGKSFLGLAVTRCRSLGLFCEDDELELHRRQDRINRAYGVEFDDLDDMIWASGVGQDNTLMRFHSDGRPARTFRLAEIQQQAIAHQARLVIIDTAADVFGGNENDRAQVRAFMGAMNALAMAIAGAVLVNAHPSRNGLSATGDLDGGSTAWSNTARSRWSLERPKAEGGIDADNDERVLTRRKANYASLGATIRLRWCNGVLVPLDRPTGLDALAVAADADDVFMRLLAAADAGNMPVSTSSQAHNFAPKVFAARPDRQGMNRKDFEAAMHRLLAAKKITLVNYGRKGDERRRIAIATEA
jgi:RecA-family ATPase